MIKLFDNHAHLDDEKFNEDRDTLIKSIQESDVSNVITAGYSLQGSKDAIKLANQYDFIYATCGISPNDIPQSKDELWKTIEEIKDLTVNNDKVLAIGEIGYDFYWNKENKELQKEAFEKQIELANELELPIVIHTREAVMDTIQMLKENNVNKKGVFHCCPMNRELVKEALKLDFYISFCGPVTFKNAKNADEMITMVPEDRILIETDSPYLSPEPRRGRRNDPRNVKYVAQKIADVKGKTLEEMAQITYENTKRIYQIKE